jgi:hypothetical protein
MTPTSVSIDADRIYFLNRDHVVLVTANDSELVITTSLGARITISGPARSLSEFADELAKDVQSNFVSIPLSLSAVAPYENAESD